MSHTQVQWGRGNTSQVAAYTGPVGELVVNTDDWSLQLQDGATAGGFVIRPRLNVTNTSATGAQSVNITDDLIVWSGTSAASFTLPASPRVGEVHSFKHFDSGNHTMTIAANAGQSIDGGSSVVLSAFLAALRVIYRGSNQWVIA